MADSTVNRSPSRWQVSLRTLLGLIFFLALALGWIADHFRQRQVAERELRRVETALKANYEDRLANAEQELRSLRRHPDRPGAHR
jgi:hypothetical protein